VTAKSTRMDRNPRSPDRTFARRLRVNKDNGPVTVGTVIADRPRTDPCERNWTIVVTERSPRRRLLWWIIVKITFRLSLGCRHWVVVSTVSSRRVPLIDDSFMRPSCACPAGLFGDGISPNQRRLCARSVRSRRLTPSQSPHPLNQNATSAPPSPRTMTVFAIATVFTHTLLLI
jgi:hypothetical protein